MSLQSITITALIRRNWMIISNQHIPVMVLTPAIAADKVKFAEKSSILYNDAASKINSSPAFISFLVVKAETKELEGQIALMPYGAFYEFTHTKHPVTFAYERDAIAFVKLEESDNAEIQLVNRQGNKIVLADEIEKLSVEEQAAVRKFINTVSTSPDAKTKRAKLSDKSAPAIIIH